MIEVTNLTRFTVDKKFFAGVAKKVLKGENKETENLSIAFVSAAEIHKLNKKYRKQNKPTDVLSFEKVTHLKQEYGEVVICPQIVFKNLKSVKNSKRELANVLIHGILHVFGYDHERSEKDEEVMLGKQGYYLSKV